MTDDTTTETIMPIAMADGSTRTVYVRQSTGDKSRWRFTLDYGNWHHTGADLAASVRHQFAEVCRRTWPNNPEWWPA